MSMMADQNPDSNVAAKEEKAGDEKEVRNISSSR
jgi:hypothetical protein